MRFLNALTSLFSCTRFSPREVIYSASTVDESIEPAINHQANIVADRAPLIFSSFSSDSTQSSDEDQPALFEPKPSPRSLSSKVVPLHAPNTLTEIQQNDEAESPEECEEANSSTSAIKIPENFQEIIPPGSELDTLPIWASQFNDAQFSDVFFQAVVQYQQSVQATERSSASKRRAFKSFPAFPIPGDSFAILQFMAFDFDLQLESKVAALDEQRSNLIDVLIHLCQQAVLVARFPKHPSVEFLERFEQFCGTAGLPCVRFSESVSNYVPIVSDVPDWRIAFNSLEYLLKISGFEVAGVREFIFLPFLFRLISLTDISDAFMNKCLRLSGFLSFAHLHKHYRDSQFPEMINELVYRILKKAEWFERYSLNEDGDSDTESVKFET